MKITEEIAKLKKEKNAVILAHNYQLPEVQDIADYVGDSLGLSMTAARTDADMIVFCGVHFMAQTSKILSPAKTVLLPDAEAGCPMADMITPDDLRALQAQHPQATALCYVNTTAEVKALCDFCCTSGNALTMARHILRSGSEIIFVPDRYLADYVSRQLDHPFIVWNGFCPTHARIAPADIDEARRLHPEAMVLAHPECTPEVIRSADLAASTEKMCDTVRTSGATEFIIATEIGLLHRLAKENPHKRFYPASERAVCPNMKKVTLEKIRRSLAHNTFEISVPRETADRARVSIERMLEIV